MTTPEQREYANRLLVDVFAELPTHFESRLLVRELACKLRKNGYSTVTDAQVNHALRRLQKVDPRVHKTRAGWKLLPEDALEQVPPNF